MKENKKILAHRINRLRKELGITQEELAIKLGLKGKSSIANYEAGNITPSDDIKIKMAELFNCSLDFLMGKSNIRNPEEIKNVPHANNGGLNTEGLDDEDIKELQKQVDYIKKLKGKK